MTQQTPSGNGLGWKRQLPDHRDFCFAPQVAPADLPAAVDLTSKMPYGPFNQLQLGSCTSNAIAAAVAYEMARQHETVFMPSRLFIYYNERALEGTIASDAGAEIRDGFKTIASQGVCPEDVWPYAIDQFTAKPSDAAYAAASTHLALRYEAVAQDATVMKAALFQELPIVLGISIYTSFESAEVASTGTVPMPAKTETLLGGHAIVCVGYDDPRQEWLMRNSWGPGWGAGGNFTLPYPYLLDPNLASDFWSIQLTS